MIDLWWMLIPMFVIWIQHRALGAVKDKIDMVFDDYMAEQDAHLVSLKKLNECLKTYGETRHELSSLYRDIAESTKVSQPHVFLMSRIERRKQMKKEK